MKKYMAHERQLPYLGKSCHSCKHGHYEEPESGQEWHVVCNECGAVFLVYEPLPYQAKFHADPHKYKMFAGGYGSGKTTTACMETIDHILSTPGGATLIGAATLPQLEQTAMKEFFEIFPKEFIVNSSKRGQYIDVFNGHRVMFRPLDEEQKARSLNLTFFWIEEANGVDYEYFTQLQTRLRNTATKKHRGILSTNPDINWIKSRFLLKAHEIHNSEVNYYRDPADININFSVHIAPTYLNTYLPDTFYEDTARGKPDWWIKRYLHGSFENREGLVFPQYSDHIIEPFEIPMHWNRWVGGDFGLANPTAFAFLATDPETGITYVYDEHYEAQKPVHYHAEKLLERISNLPYNVLKDMIGDAAGQQKSTKDMRSTFDHYAEYGVYWTPSTKKLEDSLMKMFGYFELGRLKIFKTCVNTINELSEYKYPERSLDRNEVNEDRFEKPLSRNDHLIDAIRYVIHELPDNPDDLINPSYNAHFTIYNQHLKQATLPPQLQEDEPIYNDNNSWLLYY